ncbi:hypothetical protein EI94DRAFT_1739415 [Lactarius quietus]|nr:hypothetical protein EI94DRAFT_1739415 [Lactarius quietus]
MAWSTRECRVRVIVLPLCILILCILPLTLDFSHARCISLVCYRVPIQEIQQGESCKHGLEILRPVPWTKIPPAFSFSMNDESTLLFPHEGSELFDLSQYPSSHHKPNGAVARTLGL